MNQIKRVAIQAAKKAGKMLLREYKNFDRGKIKLKSHHEIVTRADLMSEEIIIKEILNNFPHHSVLAEESGQSKNKSDYLWIIDPLDGTTNFSMHNPIWSVSIGVAYKGVLKTGVVFMPFLNELCIAEDGRGATCNGKKIKVSNVKSGKVLNTFCHGSRERDIKKAIGYYSKLKLKRLDCRQLGSAAIELCYVASGRIESIVIPGANVWDVAAGVLIAQEAGGWVTDIKGNDWNLESADMLASNGLVHREILRVINSK